MSHERLMYMKDCLTRYVEYEMCHLSEVDAEELGEAIDMIKDLEEAIYYCTITEAMQGDKNKEYEFEFNNSHSNGKHESERMYYNGRDVMEHKGYNLEEKYRNMYEMPRMYMDGGNPNAYGGNSSMSNYSEPWMNKMRDHREGRSPESRRMYMESREQGHDKTVQLRELEKYM